MKPHLTSRDRRGHAGTNAVEHLAESQSHARLTQPFSMIVFMCWGLDWNRNLPRAGRREVFAVRAAQTGERGCELISARTTGQYGFWPRPPFNVIQSAIRDAFSTQGSTMNCPVRETSTVPQRRQPRGTCQRGQVRVTSASRLFATCSPEDSLPCQSLPTCFPITKQPKTFRLARGICRNLIRNCSITCV